jgi:hypothetical protein
LPDGNGFWDIPLQEANVSEGFAGQPVRVGREGLEIRCSEVGLIGFERLDGQEQAGVLVGGWGSADLRGWCGLSNICKNELDRPEVVGDRGAEAGRNYQSKKY